MAAEPPVPETVTSSAPDPARKTGYRRMIDYPRSGRRGGRALIPSRRLVAGTLTGGLLLLAGLVAAIYATVATPDVNDLSLPTATVYEYSDGTVFYTAGLQDRVVVPLSQIPATMRRAIISVENPTFYTDAGISPRGVARALVNDVAGGPLQGGSTITQEFVKNAYLTDRQTLTRKIAEIFIAVKITRAYSKQRILDDYLNTVYFGRGSYGIDAAAETYFGVPAAQITDPGRAAYLAALVNEPSVLSQTDPASQALLRQRWNLVLDDMVKTGDLTQVRRRAVRWPTALAPAGGTVHDAHGVDDSAMAQVADGYLDELHAQDPAVPDAAMADAGGDVIRTTFSRAAMTDAVRAVSSALYRKLNQHDPAQATADRGVQAGLATVDARNGELLAFYPGRSDYNNATQAQIEPGSQMNVFALADRFPAVGAGESPPSLWALMSRVGLTQNLTANPGELPEPLAQLKDDPQLALGIAPESPARMAAAFAVFADQGAYHDLDMALSIAVNGRTVWTYTPHATQVLLPFAAAEFSGKVLSAQAPARLALGQLANGKIAKGEPASPARASVLTDTAGTAGTIGGDGSAWYTGYSGDIVTSVGLWDESVNTRRQVVRRSLNQLGGVPAAQSASWPAGIWSQYMTMVTAGEGPSAAPAAPAA
jgi:membrane peptidoglycan carboxypeptidase